MEGRELALRYVRQLIERGYTPEKADREAHMGFCGPGEPGYDISRGTIRVPCLRGQKFSFRALAAEAAAPLQMALLP